MRSLTQDIGNRLKVFALQNGSRWVVGEIQNQPAGFRRNRGFDGRWVRTETILFPAGYFHSLPTQHPRNQWITDPVRRRDNDFIAFLKCRRKRIINNLLATVRDHDPVWCRSNIIIPFELLDNSVDQCLLAGDRRITRIPRQTSRIGRFDGFRR